YDVPFPFCYDTFEEYQQRMQEMAAQTPISAGGSQLPQQADQETDAVNGNGAHVDALGYEMPSMDGENESSPPGIESEEEFEHVKQIIDQLVEKLHLGLSFGFVRIMKTVRNANSL